jgi:predicted deacetylase
MSQVRAASTQDRTQPTLLVSVHDISPLTLEASRRAVDLVLAAGVPVQALTLLVIPCHEDRAPIDEHPDACVWLRDLATQGAHLIMHGYTHRMPGRSLSPRGLFWAHGFARGQAEFFRLDAAETKRRLEQGKAILVRAGLAEATTSFVPPAWLLSPEASAVVLAEGFDCHEELGGIVTLQGLRAKRLVGWGSLGPLEACATRWWAALQIRRAPADTRFAIHPADMFRPRTVTAIRAALRTLLARSSPKSYRGFLQSISRIAEGVRVRI